LKNEDSHPQSYAVRLIHEPADFKSARSELALRTDMFTDYAGNVKAPPPVVTKG